MCRHTGIYFDGILSADTSHTVQH